MRGGAAILLLLSSFASAQLWSGVLSSARATDWTQAGVQGGIPSGSWTQCGPTITAYTGTAATINNAVNHSGAGYTGCGSNQYVLLGAGTFNLSTGIGPMPSNQVLRGSGANSTSVVFGSGVTINCNGANLGNICFWNSGDSTYYQCAGSCTSVYNWTAGYTQGTNSVTLSSTTGITTSTILALNQCDTGFSGTTFTGSAGQMANCNTGSSTDNGNYFNCGLQYNATGPVGCSFNGPNTGNGTTRRFQTELHTVTAVNSGTGVVTLGEPLIHPNWASGQSPQAWFFTPISNCGIENMSIDDSANTTATNTIAFYNAVNCWATGLRIVNANVVPIALYDSIHNTIQNNYLWETQFSDSHAIRFIEGTNDLVQNNIVQQIIDPVFFEGDETGSVVAYNFVINNCNYLSGSTTCASDGLQQSYRTHANGDDFNLYEGNVGTNYDSDGDHGSTLSQTLFRNFLTGWESCATASTGCGVNTAKDSLTNSILLYGLMGRYQNIVGNVLGTPGYHSTYQYTTLISDQKGVYIIGNSVSGGVPPYDSSVLSTLFRWANYDVVTAAVRFCASGQTGFGTTCGSVSEVPTGLSVFPQSIPTLGDTVAGQSVMPASFYLSSPPSFWGSHAWPAIGPDVSSGNVGICSGTINTSGHFSGLPASNSSQCTGTSLTASAWGGHVNLIPAMDCYLNTMSGTTDGTGAAALTFNSSACYASVTPATVSGSLSGGTLSGGAVLR